MVFFMVKDCPGQSALELKIYCEDINCYMELYQKVRRMFDLDTDFGLINSLFVKDRHLSKGMENGQVPGLPVAFNPFEFVIRAILGQQISVKAATTLAGRIAARAFIKSDAVFPPGLDCFFPEPAELLALELAGLGINKSRQRTIKTVTTAILDGRISLSPSQQFETFRRDFGSLKGIGDWTVNYVAMRGLGMVDSFPARDLGVIKALTRGGKTPPSRKEIVKTAEQWRPYRAYAALCLWNSLTKEVDDIMYYTRFDSPLCEIILVGDGDGLTNLHLNTGEGKRKIEIPEDWVLNHDFFEDTIKQIKEYICGKRIRFNVKLNLRGTDFQRKVWHKLSEIPYGELRTYKDVAESIGNKKAVRAVGMANSKNPVPLIIPCHRVIGSNGKLTGFASGLSIKERMITLEQKGGRDSGR